MMLYVLREQTEEYRDKVHSIFYEESGARFKFPPDTIIELKKTKNSSWIYRPAANIMDRYYIDNDLFHQYLVPYHKDDTYLLDQL